jgi:hypothetical protein
MVFRLVSTLDGSATTHLGSIERRLPRFRHRAVPEPLVTDELLRSCFQIKALLPLAATLSAGIGDSAILGLDSRGTRWC